MNLTGEKAKFIVLDGKKRGTVIPVQFNPSAYSVEENNSFSEKKLMGLKGIVNQFIGSKKSDLTLELMFDSTSLGTDVRSLIKPFDLIVDIDNTLHAPPPCSFVWGTFLYEGIVTLFKKEFTFFFSTGTPARVKVSITLKPYASVKKKVKGLNFQSSDISKKRIFLEGDTLFSMAYKEYKNPALWRKIAEENEIDNPLDIPFGKELLLPSKEKDA